MKPNQALSALAVPLLGAAFAACSATGRPAETSGGATSLETSGGATSLAGSGGATSLAGGGGATSGEAGAGGDVITPGQGGSAPGGSAPYLIYAHTGATLYSLDPLAPSLPLTVVGDFDCVLKPGEAATAGKVPSMTDLAVDQSLALWSVSSFAVHPITVQGSKVHCGPPITLTDPILNDKDKRFYSLSFAPAGVLDPTKEVLVAGNTAGELWAIDASGKITQHGTLGNVPPDDGHGHKYVNYDPKTPRAWEISGDIVFVANNGSPVGFATVRDCPNPPSSTGCSAIDTLVEIDMTKLAAVGAQPVQKSLRGQIVKRPGCVDAANQAYGNLYGIATWDDKVYGFSREGNLVDIDLASGAACLVKSYPASSFSGAAVTTLAPVIPPVN